MKISIAMAVYNGETYVAEQIASIANQTVKPNEIIVCDDCSTDNSEMIIKNTCKEYALNLIYIRNNENIGFNRNFEKAVNHCSGDIIFISDQDDIWQINKIESIINVFYKHSKVQLVFHDSEVVDNQLKIIMSSFWKHLKYDGSIRSLRHALFFENSNRVQGSAIAVRKSFAVKTIPFPKTLVYDYWLGLCSAYNGVIFPLNMKLLKYRQHNDNALGIIDKHRNHQSFYQRMKRLALANIEHIENSIKLLKLLHERFDKDKYNDYKILWFLYERQYCIDNNKPLKLLAYVNKSFNDCLVYTIKDFWHDLRSMMLN